MAKFRINTIALSIASIALASSAVAADVKLPKQISWTAYGTTSSGYAQSVGIGQMLTKNYGTSLRIIPGKNDVSRMVPLREGKSDICACGWAAVMVQEGILAFGTKKWGPQKLHILFSNMGDNGQSLMVRGDAGIKTPADLKGKWKQSADAVLNGQADATWGSTVSSAYNKQAASPGGIFWMNFPHSDKEGWARAQAWNPLWTPVQVSVGIKLENNTSGKVPYEGNNYPYPAFVANATMDADEAYSLTKGVLDNYEQIKDSGPSMLGYQPDRQVLKFAFPYHKGSVKYFKEKGLWKDEHEKHNNMLLKRQDVLAAAWGKMDMSLADEAFEAAWQRVRFSALKEAGLTANFEKW